jgi:UDP-N-acetylglucosamine 2-epimerase
VIDVGYSTEEILAGIERALTLQLKGTINPYGDGHSAPRIVQALKNTPLDIIEKRFCDYRVC